MGSRLPGLQRRSYLSSTEQAIVYALRQSFHEIDSSADERTLANIDKAFHLAQAWHLPAEHICAFGEAMRAQLGLVPFIDDASMPDLAAARLRLAALRQPMSPAENLRRHYLAAYEDREVLLSAIAAHVAGQPAENAPDTLCNSWSSHVLDVLLPVLELLGMWELRAEIGDAAYAMAMPKEMEQCRSAISTYNDRQVPLFRDIKRLLQAALKKHEISATVRFHETHPTSLFRRQADYRARERRFQFSDALQPMRIDIETTDRTTCYATLGIIHGLWNPIADGRFHDYFAQPRINGYRSLITLVRINKTTLAQFTISSKAQRKINAMGIVAAQAAGHVDLIPEAWQTPMGSNADTIMVFSPAGERFRMPRGSTVMDYAHKVHSMLGKQAYEFWVNGVLVQPDHELTQNDLVRVRTNQSLRELLASSPNRRSAHMEQLLRLQQQEKAHHGRETLLDALHKEEQLALITIAPDDLARTLERLLVKHHYHDLDAFFCAITDHQLDATNIAGGIIAEQLIPDILLQDGTTWPGQVHIAQCWLSNPMLFRQMPHQGRMIYGEPIVGYKTKHADKPHLIVHQKDCPACPTHGEAIPLRWREPLAQAEMAHVYVEAQDRPYLLASVLSGIYQKYHSGVYLHHIKADVLEGKKARIEFDVSVNERTLFDEIEAFYQRLQDQKDISTYEIWHYQPGMPNRLRSQHQRLTKRLKERQQLQNPYSPAAMRARHMIFGREHEVKTVLDYLLKPYNRIVMVTGPKCIGKSTFLWYLHEHVLPASKQVISVLFDVRSIDFTEKAFCRALIQRIEEQLQIASEGKFVAAPISEPQLAAAPFEFVRQRLKTIEQWQAQTHQHAQIVVLIDEFTLLIQELDHRRALMEFFSHLRGLMQDQMIVQLVLCIHDYIWHDSDTFHGLEFLREALSLPLGRLAPNDVHQLVERPLGHMVKYTPSAIAEIDDMTAGHPYYVQLICSKVVNEFRMSDQLQITRTTIQANCKHLIYEAGPYFLHYAAGLDARRLKVAKAFALTVEKHKNQASIMHMQTILRQHGLIISDEFLKEELHRLCLTNLIERCGDQTKPSIAEYCMPVGLLRSWLTTR